MAFNVIVASMFSYVVHMHNLPSEKYLKLILVDWFWTSRHLVFIIELKKYLLKFDIFNGGKA